MIRFYRWSFGALLALTCVSCIDDNYDLSDINTDMRFQVNDGKTGADWDSAPEQTGTLLMRQS